MRDTEVLAGKRDKTIRGDGNSLASDMLRHDIKKQLSSDIKSSSGRNGRYRAVGKSRKIKFLELSRHSVFAHLPMLKVKALVISMYINNDDDSNFSISVSQPEVRIVAQLSQTV